MFPEGLDKTLGLKKANHVAFKYLQPTKALHISFMYSVSFFTPLPKISRNIKYFFVSNLLKIRF